MAGERGEAMSAPGMGRTPRSEMILRALASGAGIGAVAGVASGAASFGPLGALFGLVFGLLATLVPTALGTALLATADPAADQQRYRQRIDLVLGGFAVLAVIGSGLWVAQGALAGPAAPMAALVTVLVGLWLARRWLREVTVPAHRSF